MNQYLLSILIIVACVIVYSIYSTIQNGKADDVLKAIYAFLTSDKFVSKAKELVIQAEEYITGTQKGQERLEWVAECLSNYVPTNLQEYITKDDIKTAVEIIFKTIAKSIDGHNVAVDK